MMHPRLLWRRDELGRRQPEGRAEEARRCTGASSLTLNRELMGGGGRQCTGVALLALGRELKGKAKEARWRSVRQPGCRAEEAVGTRRLLAAVDVRPQGGELGLWWREQRSSIRGGARWRGRIGRRHDQGRVLDM